MNLLKTIRKTLNLGGTALMLSTDHLLVSQGGCISGRVVTQCGELDLKPRKVVLTLIRHRTALPEWGDKRYRGWRVVVTQTLSGPCVLRAGKRYVFPFELRLPFACETSGASIQDHKHSWYLEAYLDLPLALAPFVNMPILVVPHPIVQALVKVIRPSTKFSVVNKKGLFDENDGSTNYVLCPPNLFKPVVTQVFMSVAPRHNGGAGVVFGFQFRSVSLAQRTRLPGTGLIRIRSVTFSHQNLMDTRRVFKRTAVSQEIARNFSEVLSFS